MTLTCDLVPRIIVSGAFEVGIPNLVLDFSWDCRVVHTILGHF